MLASAGSSLHLCHTLLFITSMLIMYHIPLFILLPSIYLVIFMFNLVLPARCSLVYGLAGWFTAEIGMALSRFYYGKGHI